jgi:type VI secretion system secreted protein Hcp
MNEMFLKIDDIPGESKRKGMENTIEIASFSWGAAQAGSAQVGSGVTESGVRMQDFNFIAPASKASPKLLLNCAVGKTLPTAEFICRKAVGDKQDVYIKYKFTNFVVSSYQMSGSDGAPTDSFALNFEKIEVEYKPQKDDGTLDAAVTAGFNLKEMQKV